MNWPWLLLGWMFICRDTFENVEQFQDDSQKKAVSRPCRDVPACSLAVLFESEPLERMRGSVFNDVRVSLVTAVGRQFWSTGFPKDDVRAHPVLQCAVWICVEVIYVYFQINSLIFMEIITDRSFQPSTVWAWVLNRFCAKPLLAVVRNQWWAWSIVCDLPQKLPLAEKCHDCRRNQLIKFHDGKEAVSQRPQ